MKEAGNESFKRIFCAEILEKACQKFSLWTRFRLMFEPENTCHDITYGITCSMKWKNLDGHTYVTQINYKEASQ